MWVGWDYNPHLWFLMPKSLHCRLVSRILHQILFLPLPHALTLDSSFYCLTSKAAVDTREINNKNVLSEQWSYANVVIVEHFCIKCKCSALMKLLLVTDALMWIICWILQSQNEPRIYRWRMGVGNENPGHLALAGKDRVGYISIPAARDRKHQILVH